MLLTEEQQERLRDAKLKWEEAFIDSPCSKRCVCIPFDDELNKLYEESIIIRDEIINLLLEYHPCH